MIVVVADTSPLNYLIQIECQHLLPILFERIFVPAAVVKELDHPGTPAVVRAFLRQMPQWIAVRQVCAAADPTLAVLDPGEREAIQLAKEEHADLLLMDEKMGVRLARRQGLTVIGTLGVLVQAARYGLVDIDAAFARLRTTDFRCTSQLFEQARRLAEAKGGRS
jgi:predicted nucleic acid-binding protein